VRVALSEGELANANRIDLENGIDLDRLQRVVQGPRRSVQCDAVFNARRISMSELQDTRILIIATDGFEQSELEVPRDRLTAAGARVDVAAPAAGRIRGWNHKDWGEDVAVDLELEAVNESDYDALVLPGGQINPDVLRRNERALELIRTFVRSGRIVAAICHAPWLLIEVDALKGRKATSYASIRKDVENAGATWLDQEVVVDNGIITSRKPDDLPAFVARIIEEMNEGRHERRRAAG
jgi:protease I